MNLWYTLDISRNKYKFSYAYGFRWWMVFLCPMLLGGLWYTHWRSLAWCVSFLHHKTGPVDPFFIMRYQSSVYILEFFANEFKKGFLTKWYFFSPGSEIWWLFIFGVGRSIKKPWVWNNYLSNESNIRHFLQTSLARWGDYKKWYASA